MVQVKQLHNGLHHKSTNSDFWFILITAIDARTEYIFSGDVT